MQNTSTQSIKDILAIIENYQTTDEDIDFSDAPEITDDRRGILGLYTLAPSEYAKAIAFLEAEYDRVSQDPIPLATTPPPRLIRYAKKDMDTSMRHCAYKPNGSDICNAPFKIADYPLAYFTFPDQVDADSGINICPKCEAHRLENYIRASTDHNTNLQLNDDLQYLKTHIQRYLS